MSAFLRPFEAKRLPADFFTRGIDPAGVTLRSLPALPRAADVAAVNAVQQAPTAAGLRRAPRT